MDTKGIDVEQYLPAIAGVARKYAPTIEYNVPTMDLNDLIQEGVIYTYRYIIPKWEPEKSSFLTFLTLVLGQFYNEKRKFYFNRRRLMMENLGAIESTSNRDGFSSVLVSELLSSLSDGAREMFEFLIDPPLSFVTNMQSARNEKGGQMVAFEKYLKSYGFAWEKLRGEVKLAISYYLEN